MNSSAQGGQGPPGRARPHGTRAGWPCHGEVGGRMSNFLLRKMMLGNVYFSGFSGVLVFQCHCFSEMGSVTRGLGGSGFDILEPPRIHWAYQITISVATICLGLNPCLFKEDSVCKGPAMIHEGLGGGAVCSYAICYRNQQPATAHRALAKLFLRICRQMSRKTFDAMRGPLLNQVLLIQYIP